MRNSSISGGSSCTTNGAALSISGGIYNRADRSYASISGGLQTPQKVIVHKLVVENITGLLEVIHQLAVAIPELYPVHVIGQRGHCGRTIEVNAGNWRQVISTDHCSIGFS
jgi:hypothetical protein